MKLGRPPLPADQRRIKMSVRVRPSFKAQFVTTAKRRGLTPAEAQRQALAEWIR